jgi:hypothetical protein
MRRLRCGAGWLSDENGVISDGVWADITNHCLVSGLRAVIVDMCVADTVETIQLVIERGAEYCLGAFVSEA